MSRPMRPEEAHQNRLLGALSTADMAPLLAEGEDVELAQRDVLQRAGAEPGPVYFPIDGLCSYIRTNHTGASTETGIVGSEGVVALPAFTRLATAPFEIVVQVDGRALRLPRATFQRLIEADGQLKALVCAFNESLLIQSMETTACNRLHRAEERCARWLLAAQMRLRSEVVRITHDFLALMLGASRARLSLILKKLELRGIIEAGRGQIVILDVPELRRLACDCSPFDLSCAEGALFPPVPNSGAVRV